MATGGSVGCPNKYDNSECWGEDAAGLQPRDVDTFSVNSLQEHTVQIECWVKPAALQQVTEFLSRYGNISIRHPQMYEVARIFPREVTMSGGKTTLISDMIQTDERYQPGAVNCEVPQRWLETSWEERRMMREQAREQKNTGVPRIIKVNRFPLPCWLEHPEWPRVMAVGEVHVNIELEKGVLGAGISWKMDPWMGDL